MNVIRVSRSAANVSCLRPPVVTSLVWPLQPVRNTCIHVHESFRILSYSTYRAWPLLLSACSFPCVHTVSATCIAMPPLQSRHGCSFTPSTRLSPYPVYLRLITPFNGSRPQYFAPLSLSLFITLTLSCWLVHAKHTQKNHYFRPHRTAKDLYKHHHR